MLPLHFVRIEEPLILIKMSINLLNLRDLPAEILLRLRQPVRPATRVHLCFTLECNLPGIAIELFA